MANAKSNLLELSNLIIEASLYWTGSDEEKNPKLKTIRTLAGYYLDEEQKRKGRNNGN